MLNDMPTGAMTAPKLTVKRLKMSSGSIPGNPNPFPKIVEIILLLIQFSRSVMSKSLWPHGLQHSRPPCPSPTPGIYANSCPLSQWCHPTISSSVIPFSSRLQSFPASGAFQMSQLFTSGGQSIGVSASTSVLQMNIQDWFPLGWPGWISLQSKGLALDSYWLAYKITQPIKTNKPIFQATLAFWDRRYSACRMYYVGAKAIAAL